MLAPFLLVGVGGSGGKTLRTARADLERRLATLGWDEGFPEAWQFIHIDVPTTPDGNSPDLPGGLPAGSYRGLVGSGVDYLTVDRVLTQALNAPTALAATAGWRPLAQQVSVPIDRGAGQFRAIGRVIALTHLKDVKAAIESSVARLRGPEVKGQLQRVAALLGADEKQATPEPTVLLISSIAGGSGAGAVIDVAWAMRACGIPADIMTTILYAPDVFDSIPAHLRKGVRPNALATLAELCAAWWNDEGISVATNALYNAEGITIPQTEVSIPSMILVGRKNQSVTYQEQNDVYRAMGRAVGAWVASEVVQDTFTAYFKTNAGTNAIPTRAELPAALSHQISPFRGIGFARVSLGRDLFAEYTTQYLARAGADQVLRKHMSLRRGSEDDRSDRELIEASVGLSFRGFVANCGLNERGKHANDVRNVIAPPDRIAQFEERLAADVRAQITPGIGAGGSEGQVVRALIVSAVDSLQYSHLARENAAQLQCARDWVHHIQDRLRAATAAAIVQVGAPATVAMLAKLETEEIPYLVAELRHEASEFEAWSADLNGAVQSKLAAAGTAKLQANHPSVHDAVLEAAYYLGFRAKEASCLLAAELLGDLGRSVVEPLRRAVDAGRSKLAEQEEPRGAVQSEMTLWPTGDHVPSRLRPSSNEFLLESPDTFPETLSDLLVRSVTDASAGDAETEAVAETVTGASAVGATDQTLVGVYRRWVPARVELRLSTAAPQPAQFLVALSADDLLARASHWARDPSRALGRYLGQSLATYLSPDAAPPDVTANRVRKFEGQLRAAVSASEPLVSIDPKMLQQVHGQQEVSSTYLFSVIPFPPGLNESATEAIDRVFEGISGTTEATFEDSETGFIDIFAIMDSPHQPVVFSSLMTPIGEEWAAAKLDAEARQAFWRMRRARSLPEFIPLAPGVRRAMVRGWFTASLLGRLRVAADEPFAVWDHDAKAWQSFPFPLLQPDIGNASDYLPAVLKSIPLAWLECANQHSLEPMAAYRCLRDLGASGPSNAIVDYTINRTLQTWVATGDTGVDAPSATIVADTAKERSALALTRIQRWQSVYQEVIEQTVAANDPHRAPRAYELRDDLELAFGDLANAVATAEQRESSQDEFN